MRSSVSSSLLYIQTCSARLMRSYGWEDSVHESTVKYTVPPQNTDVTQVVSPQGVLGSRCGSREERGEVDCSHSHCFRYTSEGSGQINMHVCKENGCRASLPRRLRRCRAAQRRPSLIRTHGLQPAKYDHFMSSSGVKSPAASVATGDPRTKRTHTGNDCSGWP